MGKKNKLKQLIGRFNQETGAEILALPYSLSDIIREMHVKMDLNHENALAISNVPYFLNEDLLKKVCTASLDTPVMRVELNTSTALHGDLKSGYRSGHLIFGSFQARRKAFDACKSLEKPISLSEVDLKLPAWHKLTPIRARKRRHQVDMEAKEEENIEEKMEEEAKLDADKNGEEEWVTVTPKYKHSFRGKINRPNTDGNKTDVIKRESKETSDGGPAKRKRER